MSRATVTIKQFKEIVKFTIENNLKQPILGLGAPGIGKSEVIKEIGEELGYYVEDLRLAQMSEVEIGGLIYPNADKTKTVWLKPDFFPEENGPKTILLLDEITSAPKHNQLPAYQLVLDRRIGKHKLPDSTVIIALGNREEDGGVYVDLAAPLADRFEIYDIECDANTWLEFAKTSIDKVTGKGINPLVTSFITSHPDQLHTQSENQDEMIFATPRSWKRVSDTLNSANGQLNEIAELKVAATVGDVIGSKFTAYCNQYASNHVAQDVIDGKDVTLNGSRAEILFVSDSLVSILNQKVKSGASLDECVDIYSKIVSFAGTLDGDYAQMLISEASQISDEVTSAAMNKNAKVTSAGIDSVGNLLNDIDSTTNDERRAIGSDIIDNDEEIEEIDVFF